MKIPLQTEPVRRSVGGSPGSSYSGIVPSGGCQCDRNGSVVRNNCEGKQRPKCDGYGGCTCNT